MNKLIVFEGVDASGKSTQIKLLESKFDENNISFATFREPGGNPLSERIRDILLDKSIKITDESELMLFLASRAENTINGILRELNNDKFVICDRYSDSTLAYQGYGKGLNKEFINLCNSYVTKGTIPHITIVLDIERSSSVNRDDSEKDRMENNSDTFFKNVTSGYRTISKNSPDRYFLIDGTLTIDTIHNLIWNKVKKEFNL